MPPHQRKGKHNNTVGDDDLEDYANGPLQFSEVGDESRSFGAGDGDRGNELVHNETTLPRTEAPIEEHIISSKAKGRLVILQSMLRYISDLTPDCQIITILRRTTK